MSDHTRSILAEVAHRPWPLPSAPWVMYQSWRRLLFAHWPLPHDRLRAAVPGELTLDTFDGSAWLGLTPFRVTDLRPRGVPAIPVGSDFPELNLRTYVRVGDRPGVYFFSLDAGSRLGVMGARALYHLPYHAADMSQEERAGWIHYRSERSDGASAVFQGRYRPTGPAAAPAAGTLEHFLTERYALYTVLGDGAVLRADIHHRPWPLQTAEAVIERNTVPEAEGLELPERAPLLHFAERQDTLVWAPERLEPPG
ncbi:MAG: DUF2071 domain-containing protein [Gemmatimonadetes bacterium]|nr:DUF2071 domain-containing protein [Gemmatimonadota bacterium]